MDICRPAELCVCKMWLGRNVGSTQPRIPRLNVYECMYDKSSNNKIKNSIVLHKSSLISGINRGVYTRMVSICRVINFIYIRLGKLLYHDIVLIGTMTPNRFRNCDSCKQAFDVYTLCCCRCNQRLTADIWDNREQTLPTWLKPLLWTLKVSLYKDRCFTIVGNCRNVDRIIIT